MTRSTGCPVGDPLAEILAEGKRLRQATTDCANAREWSEACRFSDMEHDFYIDHGPRLLAVAEAAVVLRNAMGIDWPLSLRDEIAAFDAAAGKVPR